MAFASSYSLPDNSLTTFKVVLIGSGDVGKTALINQIKIGYFENTYTPSKKLEITPVVFETTSGKIRLKIYDCPSLGNYSENYRNYYWKDAHAAIMMFDLTSIVSYKAISKHYDNVIPHLSKDAPVVFCGNKFDCAKRLVDNERIQIHNKHGHEYYDISVKNNYNYEKPLMYLLRKLTGNDELKMIDESTPTQDQ